MLETAQDWSIACDDIATEVLTEAGLFTPPFDMFELAQRRALKVIWDSGQAGRGRFMRLEHNAAIFLRPDDRPERLHWTIAHEIGETLAWRVAQRLGLDAAELSPRQREAIANQLAQHLLLGDAPWSRALQAEGQHLLRLKSCFPNASHELIAWRLLDGEDTKIVSIIDKGVVSRRRANFAARAPAVTQDEQRCWEQARMDGDASCEHVHGLLGDDRRARCRAWAIHEPGWQREILITWVEIE
ncbi:MAG TPA: ImmA/IrrE family metallo-endopeptidase [Planctomycetaceae bacterium]|nr:ImmA/IrrE family metallo-endopeptidase [Planctomycetaceae bacterium]